MCVCARALGEGGNGDKKVMRLSLLIGVMLWKTPYLYCNRRYIS